MVANMVGKMNDELNLVPEYVNSQSKSTFVSFSNFLPSGWSLEAHLIFLCFVVI